MRTTVKITAALLSAVTMSACSDEPSAEQATPTTAQPAVFQPPTLDERQRYVEEVGSLGLRGVDPSGALLALDDATVLDYGLFVCEQLRYGTDPDDLLTELLAEGVAWETSYYIMSSAALYLCPDDMGDLP